jgi:tRNA-guanine transglycosylase
MDPKLLHHWPQLIFITLCALTFIQVFYYLFFFSRLAFYKTKPPLQTQTHPVSVIVCARDEAANLALNLPGILVQKYDTTHEVIVVNDNSYDDSKYLLEELKKTFRQLQVTELTQEAKMIPGKKFPLSIGIKTAKHEIVLLTDADCVPASEFWISNMQAAYNEKTEIVLGYGAYHKTHTFLNKLIRWETFHSALQYFSYALAGVPYMGVGRNLSYKKKIFFRHKGFSSHNNIPGGDDDLFINKAANSANTRINIHQDSFTLSKPVQRVIGGDIVMAFDECPPYPSEYEYARNSMDLTHRWLNRCIRQMDITPNRYGYTQNLFPIIQGGTYEDLRRESAQFVSAKNAPGNAIGGLSVGEPVEMMYDFTELCCDIMPANKPRYLMGVGTPWNILECIERGVDMFDCVMPTRNGRNAMLFTSRGVINIDNKKWEKDFSLIDDGIDCETSNFYSKAYLRHLIKSKEYLGLTIASVHNLSFYLWLVKEAGVQIKSGTFKSWKNTMMEQIQQKL